MTPSSNPPISALLRWLTIVEVIVLFLFGVVMFIVPQFTVPFWPWDVPPFNARFLGAVYSAAFIAALAQSVSGRWSPARVVTPMIFAFTAIILVLSVIHATVFDFSRWEVWIWFALYVILPLNAAWHLWLYRTLSPADSTPPSSAQRFLLTAQTFVLGGYGIALLFVPDIAKTIWAWTIDTFHAQLYSATFIAFAIGAYLLTKGGSRLEWRTLGQSQVTFGGLAILGVVLVDAQVKRVDWSAGTTWVWMIFCVAITLAGAWILKQAGEKESL